MGLPVLRAGRLAPTPSGDLHLGNAVAFLAAWLSARQHGARVILRIEDVDRGRARTEVEARQRADLAWLGLDWDVETPRQSARDYAPWLARLPGVYRCVCTRRDLRAAGGVYPGTCRHADHREGAARWHLPPGEVAFVDRRWGPRRADPTAFGDPVLQRRDGLYAYPLAVVADDIVDGVTEVVRGADLLDYTAVQERLWLAFGATPPTWLHAPLILGPDGRKLSKSHGALHVGALRAAGWRPADVWRLVFPWLGLDPDLDLAEAVDAFDPTAGPLGPITVHLPTAGVPSPADGIRWS